MVRNPTQLRLSGGEPMVHILFQVNDFVYTHLIPPRLLSTSEYVVKQLGGNQSDTLEIRLLFGRRPITDIWEHWLHSRELLTRHELLVRNGHTDDRTKHKRILDEYYDVLALWCLGQGLDDFVFKDVVVSRILEKIEADNAQGTLVACLEMPVVRDIYAMTTAESKFRSLLVDAFIKDGTVEACRLLLTDSGYPREFVETDLLGAFTEMQRLRPAGFFGSIHEDDMIERLRLYECGYYEHILKGEACWREIGWH